MTNDCSRQKPFELTAESWDSILESVSIKCRRDGNEKSNNSVTASVQYFVFVNGPKEKAWIQS